MAAIIRVAKMINAIIIIIAAAVITIGILIFIIKIKSAKIKKLKFEIDAKDLQIARAAQNIKALTDYQRITNEIRANHREIIHDIENVKEGEDEKINNILHRIIDANNKRVRNSNTRND
jgi:cell division protein FtsL